MDRDLVLDIVLYQPRPGGVWVAHCVQLDLVASEPMPDDAWEMSMSQCAVQIAFAMENDQEDNLFRAPSAELMEMMATGTPGITKTMDLVDKAKITFRQVFSPQIAL